jgi:rhamnose transport system permease protein
MSGTAVPEPNRLPPAEIPGRHWSVVILKNRVVGVLFFEVIIAAIFAFSSKQFLTVSNLNTIFLNACILSILACAEGVVIITRNYDVSVASMLALAAFVGFDLIKRFPEVGPVLVLVPIVIGLVCGLINGAIVAYGKISSIFVTLAALSIYRGIVTVYAQGHQIEPRDIGNWVRDTVTGSIVPGISNLAVITIAIIVLVSILLRYTRIGRQIYAIGSNPSAATFYGLKVSRVVLGAYVLCGALTGLSGFLFASRSSYVVPWFAQGLELQVIGSVVVGGISVLGGSGNVVGAAVGAIVLTTMDNGLILVGTSEVIRQLLYGAAIVGACIFDATVLKQVSGLLKSRRRRGTRR